MRSFAFPMSWLLCAGAVLAQNPPIDLTKWTTEQINGTGPWIVDAPMQHAFSTNTAITDASVLYSDFTLNGVLEFRLHVDPSGGDDDIIGFIIGWNPGDSSSTTADYLLVDWKKTTQSFQDWGQAKAGLALSRVKGRFTRGYGSAPIDLWSHTGVCTELARGNVYGARGWEFAADYNFRIIFTAGSLHVWVNDTLEFHVTGSFNTGRFGCYNFSQHMTGFQFPLPGAFTPFGSGCRGSVGTPYLFSPGTPYVGRTLPLIIANLPVSAPVVLWIGASNTIWNGVPLPLDLTPLGAAGCKLLVSGDLLVPVTNYNGTAYLDLLIPPFVPPSTSPLFHVQGMVVDPTANGLGAVFSNGGSATVGIR